MSVDGWIPAARGCGKPVDLLAFEIGAGHFLPGGHMPCLDRFGVLPHCLAQVIGRAPEQAPRQLVLFGHADAEIFPERNHDLSKCRGLAVRALLLQDRASWKLAAFGATVAELSRSLTGVAALMGWDCDPNKHGPLREGVVSSALRNFQAACARRYGIHGLEGGLPSVACWHGIYRVLVELVENEIHRHFGGRPSSPSGLWQPPPLGYMPGFGVYPCGSSFPAEAGTGANSSCRVDLIYLPPDLRLREPDRATRLTVADVPVYDEQCFFGSGPRPSTEAGPCPA